MSAQQTANLVGSSNYSWRKTGDGQWQRNMAAAELYIYAVSSDGVPRLNILPTIRAKLHTPMERSALSLKLKSAWKALYFQVPNATFSGAPSGKGNSFNIVYEQKATSTSADEWVANTFEEQAFPCADDIDSILGKQLGEMGHRRLQRELGSTVFLRAIVFHETTSSLVTEFGLLAFVEHFAFDGTGAYNLLSKFLQNAVNDVVVTNTSLKAPPEAPFFDYLDKESLEGDHSDRLAKVVEDFWPKSGSLRVSRNPRPHDEVAIMGESRNVFDEGETTALLQKAKALGVTISQLAQAAYLVALFSQFPAQPNSQVAFTGVINMRASAGVATPYYGNANVTFFQTVSCADLGDRICNGRVGESTTTDAATVYNVSLAMTQTTQERQRMALIDAVQVDRFVRQLLENQDLSAPAPEPPVSFVSDGLLERYIQRRYSGSQLDVTVEDAHLILQDPTPRVQCRTFTFGNRLSLSLAFNSQVYDWEIVAGMVHCWANALRYCLRNVTAGETSGSGAI